MRQRRTESRLVGRGNELRQLIELAETPATGAVLLTGSPGIGKSRLAEEVLIALTERGWSGVGLSATESASQVPYSSLSEWIPEAIDDIDRGVGADQLVIQRAVESALNLDDVEGFVLVVDDVASLDSESCALLVHLATNRRIFIVATESYDDSLPEAVRRLTPAAVVEIEVGPLDVTGTAELAAQTAGGPVGPGLVREFHSRTQGNPLFITELMRAAVDGGFVLDRDGVRELNGYVPVGGALGRQIVFRLGVLSDGERYAMELLALSGELGLETLTRLVEVAHLETLERRGLVRTWHEERRLRIAISHPLSAEAIVADMTSLGTRGRWAEIAEVIAEGPGRRDEDRVLRGLASLASGRPLEAAQLLDAAYVALRLDRIRDASRLAKGAYDMAPDEVTLMGYAETLIRQGRFVEAEELLSQPMPPTADEWDHLHRAIRRSSNHLWGFQDADRAWDIDDECVQVLTDPDAVVRVVAHQAWIEYCDGRAPQALERTESLIGHDHPEVRFAVAAVRAPALVLRGRVDEGGELAQMAYDNGWGADTEFGSHNQHLIALGFAKLYQGDLSAARFVAEAAIEVCRERQETTALLFFLDLAATTETCAGNLDTALSYYQEATAIGGDLAIATSLRSSLAGSALCRAQLGHAEQAVSAWGRIDDVPPAPSPRGSADLAQAEAWVTAVAGNPADAASTLRAESRQLFESGLATLGLILAFDVARLGYADDDLVALASVAASACEGRLLGVLSEGIGASVSQDASRLDSLAEELSGMGFNLWASELAATASDIWAARGDQRQATSSQLASEASRERSEGARTPSLARAVAVDPLSRREREVAALAAAGASNNDIAERLHLSVRTVETHLQRVYRKLGVSGRGDLAASFGTGDADL